MHIGPVVEGRGWGIEEDNEGYPTISNRIS